MIRRQSYRAIKPSGGPIPDNRRHIRTWPPYGRRRHHHRRSPCSTPLRCLFLAMRADERR